MGLWVGLQPQSCHSDRGLPASHVDREDCPIDPAISSAGGSGAAAPFRPLWSAAASCRVELGGDAT
eukprot:4485118-Prorocentrum_lima.AAC.1